MTKNIIIALFILFPVSVIAQRTKELSPRQQKKKERREKIDKLIQQEESGALIFNKQTAFGIKLSTDGYGVFIEKGKYKTMTKTNLWWIELNEHKNPKEQRFATGDPYWGYTIGYPYIYGKINNFYNFKIGIGQQRLIGGKGNKNGVATSVNYGGGFALALMKPYLLDVSDPLTGQTKTIKYTDDKDLFLDQTRIIGSAGLLKGFGFTKFIPGFHLRTALRFDYGRYNELVSAIEAGVNAEYYTKEIEQMALNKTHKFFFNAYVAIVFGGRK
ncbi:MAG: hypothetical protein LC122_02090 [Chitinophagales bacterium]|nr:hypothetical protein [Chitinophagales bacterium]